nr:c-Myc-binding protein homolog isoform X4 [Physcomitrium patens]|eukprot:XP_024395804.1 c-Myc-binding protein homolog isoform X4 [Physcomitrella patens]
MAEKCVEKGCVSASEFKKKAYRDYLYSSGTVESLTQVLVMLYETHNKPENALEFIRKALGGPTIADLEQLKQEKEALQTMHDALVKQHAETCEQLLLLAATEENSSEAKSPSGKTSQRKSLI